MPKLKKFRPTCIRQWRHYRGLTLETVAERIDMTPGLVSLVERGLRGYTQDTVEALASAMRRQPHSIILYAFDLLELEGKDLSPRITNAQFTIARAGCRTVRASPLAKFIEPLTVC